MRQLMIGLGTLTLLAGCGKQENVTEPEPDKPTVETIAVMPAPPEFQQCAVCHSDKQGAPDKLGPNLFGVFETQAGTHAATYDYSPVMRRAGFKWDRKRLDAYIENPAKLVPGGKMIFIGQKDPAKRKAIIDYLETLR